MSLKTKLYILVQFYRNKILSSLGSKQNYSTGELGQDVGKFITGCLRFTPITLLGLLLKHKILDKTEVHIFIQVQTGKITGIKYRIPSRKAHSPNKQSCTARIQFSNTLVNIKAFNIASTGLTFNI